MYNDTDKIKLIRILFRHISKKTNDDNEYIFKPGYIYCLYNIIFSYYGFIFKLGHTGDLKKRLNNYTTSYPEQSNFMITRYQTRN